MAPYILYLPSPKPQSWRGILIKRKASCWKFTIYNIFRNITIFTNKSLGKPSKNKKKLEIVHGLIEPPLPTMKKNNVFFSETRPLLRHLIENPIIGRQWLCIGPPPLHPHLFLTKITPSLLKWILNITLKSVIFFVFYFEGFPYASWSYIWYNICTYVSCTNTIRNESFPQNICKHVLREEKNRLRQYDSFWLSIKGDGQVHFCDQNKPNQTAKIFLSPI